MISLSIITADDHPLLLKGLNDLLEEKGLNLVGSAQDGQQALDLIEELQPEIAILDIQMPKLSGIEIAKACKRKQLPTKIILITFHKERELYEAAQELNIFGYILKEFALEEIETCLKTVAKGEPYFSPKIKEHIKGGKTEEDDLDTLTPSEKKILRLIAHDKTNKEIASMLFISHRTVEKHRSNIIAKLDLEPKTNSLLIWAKENQDRLG
ncbi:response regulator [Aureitalea marina]|uniref:DNA-binding response regulator n=1 Tax=Aureitalea marina TaxID=930804 RepID=A0A2S7KRG4_9FLAO|nr:DNA-binding response regulator [Aureitalea marina]